MLSPSARLSQLFDLVARTLAMRLMREIPHWREVLPERAFVFQKNYGVLDAHACLTLVRTSPDYKSAVTGREHSIWEVEQIRNKWAHQQSVTHDDVELAIGAIAGLMDAISESVARETALAFRSKNFEYANAIRNVLERQAKDGCETITYRRACELLGLSDSNQDRNLLYRQLTALGILQKASGEPHLCSLVVLGDDDAVSTDYPVGIPGWGYFWLVDLDAGALLDERRTRWYLEVQRLKHYWLRQPIN